MNSPTHYPYLGYWVLHLGPYKVLCTLYAYKVRIAKPQSSQAMEVVHLHIAFIYYKLPNLTHGLLYH